MTTVQTILDIAAEGGGLTILGTQTKNGWMFRLKTVDHLATLLGDDPIRGEHGWSTSLPEVFAQIEWPWNKLSPIEVHPEFAGEIIKLKLKEDKKNGGYSYVTKRWEQFTPS